MGLDAAKQQLDAEIARLQKDLDQLRFARQLLDKVSPSDKTSPERKRCTRCDEEKVAADFGVNSRRPDGLQTYCRDCAKKTSWVAPQQAKQSLRKKTCSKCGEEKDADDFGRHAGRADGLQTYCKPCQKEHYQPGVKVLAAARSVVEAAAEEEEEDLQSEEDLLEAPPPATPPSPERRQVATRRGRRGRPRLFQKLGDALTVLRCLVPKNSSTGEACGAVVHLKHGTLHLYQEHAKSVPIAELGDYFERDPR